MDWNAFLVDRKKYYDEKYDYGKNKTRTSESDLVRK